MANNRSEKPSTGNLVRGNEYLHFKRELDDYDTQYFIIDTHGNKAENINEHQDIDFEEYSWNRGRYNKVKEGDLFIYRRPQKSSEFSGQFYFFGAGKFGKISEFTENNVTAKVEKPLRFSKYILKDELKETQWSFKERTRDDWQHFFNQYGMNKIDKEDFLMLLNHI